MTTIGDLPRLPQYVLVLDEDRRQLAAQVAEVHQDGAGVGEIAQRLGRSRKFVCTLLREAGVEPPPLKYERRR